MNFTGELELAVQKAANDKVDFIIGGEVANKCAESYTDIYCLHFFAPFLNCYSAFEE